MRVLKWAGGIFLVLLIALVLFVAFGLDALKGPIARGVTNATGRELRIDGHLKPSWSWVHPRFRAERVTFANPDWATEKLMFQADAVEVSVELAPLLIGRVVLPEVHLARPIVNLEIENITGTYGNDREFSPGQETGENKEEEGKHLPSAYCTILLNDQLVG